MSFLVFYLFSVIFYGVIILVSVYIIKKHTFVDEIMKMEDGIGLEISWGDVFTGLIPIINILIAVFLCMSTMASIIMFKKEEK